MNRSVMIWSIFSKVVDSLLVVGLDNSFSSWVNLEEPFDVTSCPRIIWLGSNIVFKEWLPILIMLRVVDRSLLHFVVAKPSKDLYDLGLEPFS